MWIISSVMSSLKFMSMHATKYRLAYLATAATSSEPKTATALRALSRGQPRQRRRQRRRRPARCKHAPLVHQLHPFPLQHIAHRCSPAENQVVHLAQHSRLRLGRKRLVPRTNQARGASDEHWASSAAPQASSKRAPLLVVRPLDQHTARAAAPGSRERRAVHAGQGRASHHFASRVFPWRLNSVIKWIDPFFCSASSPMAFQGDARRKPRGFQTRPRACLR
jgi:hypothetical protein